MTESASLPVWLTSRNGLLANNEAASCKTFAPKSGRLRGALSGHGSSSRSSWSLPRDPDIGRNAGFGSGVTAETVSELCYQGQLSQAVEALGVLVQSGCWVSESLFCTVVKKCIVEKDLVVGRRVHAFTVKKGTESDTFLGNHILRMYASQGRLEDAMDVFAVVAVPDAFTWSAVISMHVKHGQDKRAVELYHRMRRSCVKADAHVLVAALQACARGSDLETGQTVHADALAIGLERDLFVCNSLVNMYAKCGSLEDARRVFDGLGQKDVVTWTALIAGYSQQGMGQEALRLYSVMQEEGTAVPNSVTFVSLLQACASVGPLALEKGKDLHARIREQGYQADVYAANSLVNMYAKCGSLEHAQGVFDGLGHKDVVAWNAMIAGYSQQGMGQEALSLYTVMQEQGIAVPSSVTFVCLLQACASVGTLVLETGKKLHVQIREQGHHDDVFVANSLVNMYAKCGSLEDAQKVFDELGHKDVVTWNAMIAGYSHQGMGHEAFSLHSAMQEEGMAVPNSVTYLVLLQACASVGISALEKGRQLHSEVREQGYQDDMFVANSLVNMYAKCGSLEDAQSVFDGLGKKDVVSWTALIAGYSQQGMGQEALCLYSAMQEEGIAVPNSVTYVCLLQACASVGTPALEKGKQLHAEIRERGYQADIFVANSLVNMYAKCGSLESAQTVFDGLGQKDVVTWNAMIAGCSQHGMGQAALRLYGAMLEEGIIAPDSVTYVCLLQACATLGVSALEKGKLLHAEIRKRGHQADVYVVNSLLNMYAKCGSMEDAQRVFDGLSERDVVTWNAIIAGYAQQGMGQEALRLFSTMQAECTSTPDSVTFVCLLQACASIGTLALEKGKDLHAQITERGYQADMMVANSLVNMYAKCGSLEDARRVFEGLDDKDLVTWTALIAGYSQQGMGQEALRLYSLMQEEGMAVLDSVTFGCLLQACANVAALHLGRELHAQIEEEGLEKDLIVAGSLINMYGKSGAMKDAQQVFDALPQRDAGTWNALISGYSCQGDTELVFDLVQRMLEDGIQPVGITFLSILTVCSHAGLVIKGREYFEAMSRQYGITPVVEHYTCMVDLLGRAGHLDEALDVLRTMPVVPNAAVWCTLLVACRNWGNVDIGRYAFDQAVKLDNEVAAAYVLMSNIYTGAQMWEQARSMQERRISIRAWKQPGQSWWTDMDGLVHSFLVGDERHPKREARWSQESSKIRQQGFRTHLDSLGAGIANDTRADALFPIPVKIVQNLRCVESHTATKWPEHAALSNHGVNYR